MIIVNNVKELQAHTAKARKEGRTIGLVPTMGYLHKGHLTLMQQAKAEQNVVIASIFVNPLQFGPKEDYSRYPRDIQRDSELAANAGVDILFVPEVEELYPQGLDNMFTFVEVKYITEKLCGASRPGHFRGVTTVVNKLFNIVQPDAAYFGQKDAQQVVVIKRMVADLNINIKIVAVPIVREEDGLALSSRNVFLSQAERKAALSLSQSLKLATKLLASGERDATKIRGAMENLFSKEPLAAVDYISLCDANSLEELQTINQVTLIALAVKIGNTRLIDNLIWEEKNVSFSI